MNAVIEKYKSLAEITAQMRLAALQDEWDLLAELEEQSSTQVAELKVVDLTPIDEATRLEKVVLIKKILADDAAIRNKMEPWMAQLQRIMGSARSEDLLQKTYTAEASF
jgi:flagellar protein FliT